MGVSHTIVPREQFLSKVEEKRQQDREYRFKGEDWFPARTDQSKSTVRSRVYVTSASTMHTFLNVLSYHKPAVPMRYADGVVYFNPAVLGELTDLG